MKRRHRRRIRERRFGGGGDKLSEVEEEMAGARSICGGGDE